MNPLRTGLLTTLREMGAEIEMLDRRDEGGEDVADLRVRGSSLRGVDVPAERAPSMIDEYPILAVAAAFAGRDADAGLERIAGQGIRPARRDRGGLAGGGRRCAIDGDDLIVEGRGGECRAAAWPRLHLDHRIAMSFLCLGLAARRKPMAIDDATHDRDELSDVHGANGAAGGAFLMIIAIDGPAASGKGTLARRLARHLDLPHLDTGLLYRATARALMDQGHDLARRSAPRSPRRAASR